MPATFAPKRPGLSLIEVLVAIFVMGIGLLCLLTLFPLGAMRMAAAFKDERSAQCSMNARAIATMTNLRNDPAVVGKFRNPGDDDNAPSQAVFVDPAGSTLGLGMLGSNIARVSPSWGNSMLFFALHDDITFQRGYGVPKLYGGNVEREMLYTWAYLVQRPQLSESAANVSVCVFQRRPKAGTLEIEYSATMNPVDNTVTLTYAGVTPNIQPGMWILDGTVRPPNKYPYARFYRITGVRDGSPTSLVLDLQAPLQGYGTATPYAGGQVVALDGLVEVFELGSGR